jgi:hypothetical protein
MIAVQSVPITAKESLAVMGGQRLEGTMGVSFQNGLA